jgi:hypothetical protein
MRTNFRLTLAAITVIMLAGCNRQFTNDLAFRAPAGWVHAPAPGGGELWVKGGKSGESIMAQRVDTPLPPRHPDWKNISICGDHPAVFMVQKNNPGQIWEGVSTNWGPTRYMAVYVRPVNSIPDRQAEAAIRALCLKRH